MRKFNQKIWLVIALFMLWTTPVLAHRSPDGCSGSGLGINLSTNSPRVHIGDVISYSLDIFNGTGIGPVVCDATGIQASIITPDGQNHPISLTRTSLSNGQIDSYSNVLTYTARSQDVKNDGTLTATANDTGIIHQNDTDSSGGGNQGVNVTVLSISPPSPPSPPSTPPTLNSSGSRHHPIYTPTPTPVLLVTTIPLPSFPTTGRTIDIYGIINSILVLILIICLGKLYFV